MRRRWAQRLLGMALLVLLGWQLWQHDTLKTWWPDLQSHWRNNEHRGYLLGALLLMPLNWALEVAKWRCLITHVWPLSRWQSWRAVLAGVSVSILTPNRIGEYGGRLLFAPAEQRIAVVLSTVAGSVAQWGAFLLCGWPSLVYWLGQHQGWSLNTIFIWGVSVPLLLLLGVLIVNHLLARKRRSYRQYNRWWRWLRRKSRLLLQIGSKRLLLAFGLALLRFWVYTFQYLLLLWFFGQAISFGRGVSGIFSIYLLQAGIPLPPGFSVITRSELAILIWGPQWVDPLSVVSATFGLYLINLLLPALLGAFLIVKKENPSDNETDLAK